MNGGNLINYAALSKLIEKKTVTKQATALHDCLKKFPLGEELSGREVHRRIRLEMMKYKQPNHS